jgi:hypothetical protein
VVVAAVSIAAILAAAGGGSTAPKVLQTKAPAASGDVVRLRSMPGVELPVVTITKKAENTAPGLILANPRAAKKGQRMGPMVFDEQGRVRWFHRLPADRTSVNLQVQEYDGKKVITWAQRPPVFGPEDVYNGGYRTSYMVVADEHYRVLERIRVKGVPKGLNALHEFHITPKGTAFLIGFRNIRTNLAPVGGPRRGGEVTEGLVQEIDLHTGKVLLDWRSLDHVPLTESVVPFKRGLPYDYIHLNSVSEDSDGNLLVSARHTGTVYKLDRTTGKVIWRLGGKSGDFAMGEGATFKYQHDAQRLADGTLQVFDNAASDFDSKGVKQSLVLRLNVDTKAKRATVAKRFVHPQPLLAVSQGNSRVLPNGNLFVGWGSMPYFSEFSPDGKLLWDAKLPTAAYQSYRGFKAEWKGTPQGKPKLAVEGRGKATYVYASLNGSTEVTRWRVRTGTAADSLEEAGTGDWAGLETRVRIPGKPAFVQVEALDASGNVLGASPVVKAG